MDLNDALRGWPSGGGGGGEGGGGAWPGPTSANPTWPGCPPGGGGAWPGCPPGGGGAWPGGQSGDERGGGGTCQPQPSAPGGWPSPAPGFGPGSGNVIFRENPAVPCKLTLQNGVCDKLLITIIGCIKPNANMITVDMCTSTRHDLAFHLNPRFNENGRPVIVANSCICGKWGREERESCCPFSKGQKFKMTIFCTNTGYQVKVNDCHLLHYKHRIPELRDIKELSIYNDLALDSVRIECVP